MENGKYSYMPEGQFNLPGRQTKNILTIADAMICGKTPAGITNGFSGAVLPSVTYSLYAKDLYGLRETSGLPLHALLFARFAF